MEDPELYVVASACPQYSTADGAHSRFVVPPHPLVPVQLYGDSTPLRSISYIVGEYSGREPRLYRSTTLVCVVRGAVTLSDSVSGRRVFEAPCSLLLEPGTGVLLQREHTGNAVVFDMDFSFESSSSTPQISSFAGSCFAPPNFPVCVELLDVDAPRTLRGSQRNCRAVECTVVASGAGDIMVGRTSESFASGTVSYRVLGSTSAPLSVIPSEPCVGAVITFDDTEGQCVASCLPSDVVSKERYSKGLFFKPLSQVYV